MQSKITEKIEKLQKKIVDQREYFKEKMKRMEMNYQSQIQKLKKTMLLENQDFKAQINQMNTKIKEQGMLIKAYENENPESNVLKLMKNNSPEKLRRASVVYQAIGRRATIAGRQIKSLCIDTQVPKRVEIDRYRMTIEDLSSKMIQLQTKIQNFNRDKSMVPKSKSM